MEKKLILRDYLAGDRTHLANERTLLAYFRTALAFIGVGAFLIRFYPEQIYVLVSAVIFIILGIGMFIFGTSRFNKVKNHIDKRLY